MKKIFLASAVIYSLSFIACNPDEHNHDEEQEVITKVTLTFNDDKGNKVVGSWSDIDGDSGAKQPIVDKISLKANTVYNGTIELFNETTTPITNLTNEINTKKEEHLWVYKFDKDNVAFEIKDFDANNKPVGLQFKATTTANGVGKLRLILKHLPNKSATDPSATGETDIDVSFDVAVE